MSGPTTIRVLDTGTQPARCEVDGVELCHQPALIRRARNFDRERVRRRLSKRCHVVFYSRFSARVVADADIVDEPARHRFWAVGARTADLLSDEFDVAVEIPEDERFTGLHRAIASCGERLPIVAFGLHGTNRDLSGPARDWDVDFTAVAVYESAPREAAELAAAFDDFEPHWITVTSSRGADAIARAIGTERLRALQASGDLKIAAIGPSTAQTLEELGLRADLVPETPDRDTLVALIATPSPT